MGNAGGIISRGESVTRQRNEDMNRHDPIAPHSDAATGKAQGQRLDGDNLQSVLDSGANAWRVGRQQFFTPHELGRTLMLPLPAARESFVDLTMGAGALLSASGAANLYGIDIDSRLARKPTSNNLEATNPGKKSNSWPLSTASLRPGFQIQNQKWHTVCADLTRFYPLLQEIDWRFDLCGLNPPFSVRWHKPNLVALIDSELDTVRQTFGRGKKPTIDSVLATFLIALDRMTDRGEGFLICTAAAAQKIAATPVGKHIWLWVTVKEKSATSASRTDSSRGEDEHGFSFDVAVIYFARAHRGPEPFRLSVESSPGFLASRLTQSLAPIARQRALLRKGLSIFYPDHFCPLTRELWDAAKEEWLRVNRTEVPGDYNIWLRKDGTIWRHLTPFQTWSGKIPRAKADLLNRLAGQTPMSLVVQKATRLALLAAIGKNNLESKNPGIISGKKGSWFPDSIKSSPWRVDPDLTAAVENALAEYHAQRAPFYPLNEVQRLGYLDEEDMIKCKLEGLTGFKPGKTYPLSSETIDVERQDERLNLLGNIEEITLQGKELAFYIEDERGDKHAFLPAEAPCSALRSFSSAREGDYHHDLHALIRYFEIPEVADVAQIDPDRYNNFVNQIRAIESAVNNRISHHEGHESHEAKTAVASF